MSELERSSYRPPVFHCKLSGHEWGLFCHGDGLTSFRAESIDYRVAIDCQTNRGTMNSTLGDHRVTVNTCVRYLANLCFVASLVTLIGCDNAGKGRVVLTGKLSYRGEPLDVGEIRFIPESGTKAPLTIVPFRGGSYDSAITNGVPVGKYRVEITAMRSSTAAKSKMVNGDELPVPAGEVLPAKYNTKSELTEDVTSGERSKVRDFVLD